MNLFRISKNIYWFYWLCAYFRF